MRNSLLKKVVECSITNHRGKMIFAAVTYHMFMNHQLKLKYVIDLFLYEYHNLVDMTRKGQVSSGYYLKRV